MNAPTARDVASRLLHGAADAYTAPGCPPGCLLVQGLLVGGAEAEPARAELATRRAQGLAALRERFTRAVADGDLPADTDPASLAQYVNAVGQGISVQAADGASRANLHRLADEALRHL